MPRSKIKKSTVPKNDPLWYKDAIIYQLHVKTFRDSNGDGIGDFKGLLSKLDYLESLGVTAIWLLPFYPSPLRDDGYDIADYYNVNPDFGTLDDFKMVLAEAHARGLRVITELVINHTSDQHEWFQKARNSEPGSKWRDFYVWSAAPDKYEEARIIFPDFETSNWTWDPKANAYYWHRFYSHQPDLNFENPQVGKEIMRVMDFWFDMGVDGLRLDAVPYLFEREGTNCENLPETHEFLKSLRQHVDKNHKDKMLLAEANQWPEDVRPYFGDGDECHMAFHFPVMPRMFMALQMEDRFPLIDILQQTPQIPDQCQWATFLRNHDELTLEMVTDEERDYMWRVYAKNPRAKINVGIRRRLAPLLDNSRKRIELMNILLLSLPGTPTIYYGDEIGMGDNFYLGDRDGVRTPMQWTLDRNAGFSSANPQSLFLPAIIDPEYHYESINVENQERNLSSLLWWMKRVISLRKRSKALCSGTLEFLRANNPKVFPFIRHHENEVILVVVNLSRFAQSVEIEMEKYAGQVPVELFSQNPFPTIPHGETEYCLTLGPHGHYWLKLQDPDELEPETDISIPEVEFEDDWRQLLDLVNEDDLARKVLAPYLRRSRWLGSKARVLRQISIVDKTFPEMSKHRYVWLWLEVSSTESSPQLYLFPLAYADKEEAARIQYEHPTRVIARVKLKNETAILYDGIHDRLLRAGLLKMITGRKDLDTVQGHIKGRPEKGLPSRISPQPPNRVLKSAHTNDTIFYDDAHVIKLYRKLESGKHPEPEMLSFLTNEAKFTHIPAFLGTLEYTGAATCPMALLMTQIAAESDAWDYTTDTVKTYYEKVLTSSDLGKQAPVRKSDIAPLRLREIRAETRGLVGEVFLEMVQLMGRRIAELHIALVSAPAHPEFAPEPFTLFSQRSIYQSIRTQVRQSIETLSLNRKSLPKEVRKDADFVVAEEETVLELLSEVMRKKIRGVKSRIHGQLHLGQLLFTGKDFYLVDFEGDPSRPPSERRMKRSPLRDIASMLRSFHYAAYLSLSDSQLDPSQTQRLVPWAELWTYYVSGIFLGSYIKTASRSPFHEILVPEERSEFSLLLRTYLIEQIFQELQDKLDRDPDSSIIPIRGIRRLLAGAGEE